jgi:hypothetical protein
MLSSVIMIVVALHAVLITKSTAAKPVRTNGCEVEPTKHKQVSSGVFIKPHLFFAHGRRRSLIVFPIQGNQPRQRRKQVLAVARGGPPGPRGSPESDDTL